MIKNENKEKEMEMTDAYKSCKYLENFCKESLSPNEPCIEECENELIELKKKIEK